MLKICGQPIKVMENCSDGNDDKYIGLEGWVIESWDHMSEVVLPNTDDPDKSAIFFNYQLEFLPLLDIDKVRILTFYFITKDQCFGGNDDEAICKATGLETSDLDKHYSLAESICSQSQDIPNNGTIQSMLVNADKIVSFKFNK